MNENKENQGQAWIKNQVMAQGLCTGCAACVGLCPYQKFYRDQTAIIHECDRTWGRCSAYCPRGQVDLNGLRGALFDPQDLTPELGALKGLYMTRATDPELRTKAQHGGTVSALVALALEQGMIDTAVLAESEKKSLRSRSVAVSDPFRRLALCFPEASFRFPQRSQNSMKSARGTSSRNRRGGHPLSGPGPGPHAGASSARRRRTGQKTGVGDRAVLRMGPLL